MGRIAFLDSPNPTDKMSPVCAAFLANFPDLATHTDRLTSIADVEAVVERTPIDATIFRWDSFQSPHALLEDYWQNVKLCAAPLIILHTTMDAADRAHIDEYGQQSIIKITPDLMTITTLIRNAIVTQTSASQRETRLQQKTRQFFHKIHAGEFDAAEGFLDGHIEGFCTPIEQAFYQALILKTRKRFDEAVTYLAKGLQLTASKMRLEPRFLHLIGNVALKRQQFDQAIQFLEAATKISPKNLRRRFLLGQAYLEKGDGEAALRHFMLIYRACKTYPGIHGRMAELLCARATDISQVDKIAPLLPSIADRNLANMYKKLPDTIKPEHKRRMLDLVIREFSIRANKLIDADDFYAALKPYSHIEKLLAPDDITRARSLAYCYARVYLRAAEYDRAEEYLVKALDGVTAPSEKVLSLKRLIEKGKAEGLTAEDFRTLKAS